MNYKLLLFSSFLILLFVPTSAYAQMSRGTIENSISNDETRNCEYTSIQSGADLPIRLAVTYPSTPNVLPHIEGTDPQTQFSSDFNQEGFFFSTNSTDLFKITLNIGYENQGAEPRNIFYEFFTDGSTLFQTGNWRELEKNICKVIEINAQPPQHINTDEEIIKIVADWEVKQHEITHKKQDATNDMIAVIVIIIVGVGATFIGILFIMKIKTSKDTANSILVSKQFGKAIEKINDLVKVLKTNDEMRTIKVDYIVTSIERSFRDIMIAIFNHEQKQKKSAFPKIQPITESNIEKIKSGMGMFDKVKSIATSHLGIKPKTDEIVSKFSGMTIDELYAEIEKRQKEVEKYNTDEVFRTEYNQLHDELNRKLNK